MTNTELTIWHWIIEKNPSSINTSWSFYSSDFCAKDTNSKANLNISLNDVDWTLTKPLRSSTEAGFTSTFNDPDYCDVLEGYLVLKNGTKYFVGLRVDSQQMLNDIVDYLTEKQNP